MTLQLLFDPSAEQLVSQVADHAMSAIKHAWRDSREAHIVITGGRTGLAIAEAIDFALYRLVGTEPEFKNERLRIWLSDERFVGYDDSDRSDTALIAAFRHSNSIISFERVGTPAEGDLDSAAEKYANTLDSCLGQNLRFDCVILSMGEDGHVASLFPGHTAQLASTQSAVAVANSPKSPSQRVSIGVARLAKSSAMYIFALGESKREPLTELLGGAQSSEDGPIKIFRQYSPASPIYLVTDLKITE